MWGGEREKKKVKALSVTVGGGEKGSERSQQREVRTAAHTEHAGAQQINMEAAAVDAGPCEGVLDSVLFGQLLPVHGPLAREEEQGHGNAAGKPKVLINCVGHIASSAARAHQGVCAQEEHKAEDGGGKNVQGRKKVAPGAAQIRALARGPVWNAAGRIGE